MRNSQAALPEYSSQFQGCALILGALRGQQRHAILEHWLSRASGKGASGWIASYDFEQEGPWAGLKDLVQAWYSSLCAEAPDLVERHAFELVSVLPTLRRTLAPRNPTLTDLAQEAEQVRLYPADRALRILHGLIDMIAIWKARSHPEPWILACDNYDKAGHLVRRFFRELMRRRGAELQLTLVLACDVGAEEVVRASLASTKSIVASSECEPDPPSRREPEEMSHLATALEASVGNEPENREIYLPKLIYYWTRSETPERALPWQYEAFSTFTSRGFYEDSIAYGTAALEHLELSHPGDTRRRWKIVNKLFACYCTCGNPEAALELVSKTLSQLEEPYFRALAHYVLAMLHARYLPDRDMGRAEQHLDSGLNDLLGEDLPRHELSFQVAFNRNGLALVRYLQGRHQEAIDLCQAAHERLSTDLREDQHRLHRSVLLYNIAQVYSALGALDEAIQYYTSAMAMDPNYSEYYNERGNLLFKKGLLSEAVEDYNKAVELSPPFPEVYANLGHCNRRRQRFEDAILAYNRCLDINPEQAPILVARAESHESLGREEEALKDYSRALELDPLQPLILANRACLYYGCGRLTEALRDLGQAIHLAPENAELYQNRSVAFTDLGRPIDAAQDLEMYLQLSPPTAADRSEVLSRVSALREQGQSAHET